MMDEEMAISERFLAEVFCPPSRPTRALLWVLAWGSGSMWGRFHRRAVDRAVERSRRRHAIAAMPTPSKIDRTLRHSLLGLASVSSVIAVAFGLAYAVPFMDTRLLDVVLGGQAESDGALGVIGALVFVLMFALIIGGLLVPGAMKGAAMNEELKYRFGAEEWSGRRRAWMAFRFGAAHIFNIIVPVSVIVGLSLSGALFTWVYVKTYRRADGTPPMRRQQAIEQASAVHAAHNVWALRILVLWIGGAVLWSMLT